LNLTPTAFFNGAQRRAQLLAKGNIMFVTGRSARPVAAAGARPSWQDTVARRRRMLAGLGDDTTDTSSPVTFDTGTAAPYQPVPIAAPSSSVASDVLSFFKSALPIYNAQQVFNQQLKAGTITTAPVAPAPSAASNIGKIALIGGAGVLALMLFKGMARR
jgi:hypothetical protein